MGWRVTGRDSAVVLLPSVAVLFFQLMRGWVDSTTALGLAFLGAVSIAYWLFPKTRVSVAKLLAAGLLAVLTAWLTTSLRASFWGGGGD